MLSLLALITGCGATPPEVKAYKEVSPENTETIYLAGGCFWGVQKYIDQFDGVITTEVGYAKETSIDGISKFLEENGYTYPVVMDEGATLQLPYYITAYPTTFIINPEGYVLGYIPGSMTKEIMEDVIDQARK